MKVTLPPSSYVLSQNDYDNVRLVMFRLYDGSSLDSSGRKSLARLLDNATRNASRVRDLLDNVRDLTVE